MLRLQRHLLGELLTAFALVLVIITGIVLAGSLLQVLSKVPELSVVALLQATPLFLALALPLTVPVSFLMACLLCYGRFADDNEFLAFQLGGLSPWHAVAPGICAAALLSAATLHLNTDVNPTMTSAKKQLLRVQIREEVARMRDPARTSVRLPDMEMSWDGRDGEWLTGIFLTRTETTTDETSGRKIRQTKRVTASRAKVQLSEGRGLRLLITLIDPRMPDEGDGKGLTAVEAKELPILFSLDEESSLSTTKAKDEMRGSELYYRMVRLEPRLTARTQGAEWKEYHGCAGEYWRRIALGFSPLAFAMLGVPLGLVVRRGTRAKALLIALGVALPVYYPVLLWGDNVARAGHMPAALALNVANILLAATGLALLARLVTR